MYGRKNPDAGQGKEELVPVLRPVPSFLFNDLNKADSSFFSISPGSFLAVIGLWTLGLVIFTDSLAEFLMVAGWGLAIFIAAVIILSFAAPLWRRVKSIVKSEPRELGTSALERNIAVYDRLYAMSESEEVSSVLVLGAAKFCRDKFYSLPFEDVMNRVALAGAIYFGLGKKNCFSGHSRYCSHRVPRKMTTWVHETLDSLEGESLKSVLDDITTGTDKKNGKPSADAC